MSFDVFLSLPVLSASLMLVYAVFLWLKVGGKVGFNLGFVSLFAGLWALFLYLEYHLEYSAYQAGVTPDVGLIKIYSTAAGFSAFIIPTFFLKFAIEFPPVTRYSRWLSLLAMLCGLFFGGMAYFGMEMRVVDQRIQRIPSYVMQVQFVGFLLLLGPAILFLVIKHRYFLSNLRRNQLRFLGLGVFLAMISGGPATMLLPLYPVIVMVASFSPILFILSMIIGVSLGRQLFRDRIPSILPEVPQSQGGIQDHRRNLQRLGIEYTHYLRNQSESEFHEMHGKDKLHIPNRLWHWARENRVFFFEDFDEEPDSPCYQFLRRNYIQAGLCFWDAGIKNSDEHLILIHSVGSENILTVSQIRSLEQYLI